MKYWLSWEKMCPKGQGGFELKDLKSFNLALLAKQGWRLIQNEDSLLHKVFKAQYFFHNNYYFKAKLGSNPSYAW